MLNFRNLLQRLFQFNTEAVKPEIVELKASLETSSRLNRNLSLVFIAFLIYNLITVASVTDLTLLLPQSNVRLPLIDIEIGLNSFVFVAPLIIFVLHINLLIHLISHNIILKEWVLAISQQKTYLELAPPFIFNFAQRRFSRYIRIFAIFSVFLVYVIAPIVTLLVFQVRFSDHQDIMETSYHFSLLILDVILLSFFAFRIFNSILSLKNGAFLTALLVVILFIGSNNLIISFQICYKPKGEYIHHYMNNSDHSFFRSVLFHQPRIDVRGATLLKEEPKSEFTLFYLDYFTTRDGKNSKFKDAESEAKFNSLYHFSEGIDLSQRTLRFAVFDGALMPKADLEKADLYGASFLWTLLISADFNEANLSNSKLDDADLRRANLIGAKLQGSSCLRVQFQSAHLQGSRLQDAVFDHSDMRFIDIEGADIENASLSGVQITSNLKITMTQRKKLLCNSEIDGMQLFLEDKYLKDSQLLKQRDSLWLETNDELRDYALEHCPERIDSNLLSRFTFF